MTVLEMKTFISVLLNMGLVMKSSMDQYWVNGGPTFTPWFSNTVRRNHFFSILSNFHISDIDKEYDQPEDPKDRLFKILPLLNICKTRFTGAYSPQKNLSVDEATCPFKGRLSFKVYLLLLLLPLNR